MAALFNFHQRSMFTIEHWNEEKLGWMSHESRGEILKEMVDRIGTNKTPNCLMTMYSLPIKGSSLVATLIDKSLGAPVHFAGRRILWIRCIDHLISFPVNVNNGDKMNQCKARALSQVYNDLVRYLNHSLYSMPSLDCSYIYWVGMSH